MGSGVQSQVNAFGIRRDSLPVLADGWLLERSVMGYFDREGHFNDKDGADRLAHFLATRDPYESVAKAQFQNAINAFYVFNEQREMDLTQEVMDLRNASSKNGIGARGGVEILEAMGETDDDDNHELTARTEFSEQYHLSAHAELTGTQAWLRAFKDRAGKKPSAAPSIVKGLLNSFSLGFFSKIFHR